MARQKGLFKVTGTLGGVNFYVVKGVGYARIAECGFNGKAIRTKPSMVRVHENASDIYRTGLTTRKIGSVEFHYVQEWATGRNSICSIFLCAII